MSSKSVKFEISLKELKVTFEGDIQTAERMQGQITGAINSLASAQNRLLAPATPSAVAAPITLPPSGGRRRRRRNGPATPGIDPTILDGAAVADSGNGAGASDQGTPTAARRVRRSSGGNQAPLITDLKGEGFFSTKRGIGDIRSALARKGHTFKSNEISPTLTRLTKDQVLKREQDTETGQWMYYAE